MEASNNKDNQRKFFKAVPEEKSEPIFAEETIKSTVQGFILAFISGKIQIIFTSQKELEDAVAKLNLKEVKRLSRDNKKLVITMAEIQARQRFTQLISICCGTIPATSVEQKKAFNDLFGEILAYRSSGRIIGEFVNYDIAERVSKLEEGIEKINNLIKQLIELHSNEMGL